MKIDIEHMHEVNELIKTVEQNKTGAMLVFGATLLILLLGLAALWLAKH